jgi:Transposase DDE domain/Transposase domain (DUF772)
MTLGLAPRQADLFRSTAAFCEGRVAADSIYGILHRECFRLFPDEMFADLFDDVGRRSVPPMIVAVVMVLQRIEGCSDREAVDRFAFDARWKYAAGGLDFDYPGFVHTVLVDMRARLARSKRPDRIFEVTLEAARAAGLVGRRRVLDSTPLYDAVATMDTVTLVRSAIRGLLKAAGSGLDGELRAVLARDDDYVAAGKPACDYDDPAAREALVDALAKDAHALLGGLEGQELEPVLAQAAQLLATVTGQDLEQDAGGVFKIARRVAADRVISTVDPDARHGHKTSARGFDGYKGHIAIDPDSEIVTATAVTPGNSGDAEAAEDLLADVLPAPGAGEGTQAQAGTGAGQQRQHTAAAQAGTAAAGSGRAEVYGDAAYGSGELLARVEDAGLHNGIKVQPPAAVTGHFPKDRFAIDLDGNTVTCPAGITVPIRTTGRDRQAWQARFGRTCRTCPLAAQCTTAAEGRTITIGPHETTLAAARKAQASPAWQAGYKATRPKVERKIGHLMRRRHGGRRARARGQLKVAADFALLAAAVNLARLAVLGVTANGRTWTAASA